MPSFTFLYLCSLFSMYFCWMVPTLFFCLKNCVILKIYKIYSTFSKVWVWQRRGKQTFREGVFSWLFCLSLWSTTFAAYLIIPLFIGRGGGHFNLTSGHHPVTFLYFYILFSSSSHPGKIAFVLYTYC